MKNKFKQNRKQRGFTLVEMSVTMAAAGLLFAAVTTGQELIDQAKATKLVNDVKTIEMQLQQFAQIKGRLPGDCDVDGVIDFNAGLTAYSSRGDSQNAVRAEKYSYSVLQPTTPDDGNDASEQTDGCALLGAEYTAASGSTPAVGGSSSSSYGVTINASNANVWLNDLKLAGVISDSAPNRKLAKLVHEDFVFVGRVVDAGGASANAADYNAMVIHNVPQWMARRLATAINGQDARADRSRVRLLDRAVENGTYSTDWQSLQQTDALPSPTTTFATRDGMVSVVYYFDRVPESKMGGV